MRTDGHGSKQKFRKQKVEIQYDNINRRLMAAKRHKEREKTKTEMVTIQNGNSE